MCVVLVVDDEPSVRDVMSRQAEQLGHDVTQATTADEALERMAERVAGVVLCDITLPGQDGVWLAGRLRQAYPDTAVVMATAHQGADVALASLRQGAVDFLEKPFGREQFRAALGRGVRWHENATHARERLENMQREVRDHLAHLESFLRETPVASDADLEHMIEQLMPDRGAREHAQRVAALSANIALKLEIRGAELADIRRAALLHDLGRAAMPSTILCKPARLSDEEIAIVREQPRLVSQLLEHHPFLGPAAVMTRATFERFDGTGYPWALRRDEIPLGARVIAVADALDAMTHYRLHRDARTPAEAIFEIQRGCGTQFDPAVVEALLTVVHLHWASMIRHPADEHESPPPARV